jgi:hypothetical protein
MAIQDPAQLSTVRTKLMLAGYYSREAAAIYLGVKAAAMIAGILGIVLMLPLAFGKHGGMLPILGAAGFALVSIMGPDQFIKSRRTKREREYREGFPDMLDLLVASVEAGLSLDAGVTRVTDELFRRYPNLALPTLSAAAAAEMDSPNQSFASPMVTVTLTARQRWPAQPKAESAMIFVVVSWSASGSTTT